jgi:hypothetical protein
MNAMCRVWANAVCVFVTIVWASGVAGCGSDGSTGGTSLQSSAGGTGTQMSNAPAAKFSDIYAMAFPAMTNPRCEFCHSMPPSDVGNGKLHMGSDPATAYAALVGKVSVSAFCMGRTIVDPGHPETSLMYLKLSPNPPCGNRMPLGGTPFTDVQLEMVRSWIAAGAMND